MRFINTRPSERANPVTQDMRALGYDVFEFPLLALDALPLDLELIEQFKQFITAKVVVAVSPIAVELGLQYCQQLKIDISVLQQKTWIAVGQKTQHSLALHNITSICPEVETSEGMLQLPQLDKLKSCTVAFWRGIGGREFLMNQLQQQQCQIVNMLLYTRYMPYFTSVQLTQFLTILPAVVLISSEESWKNWLSLLGKLSVSQTILSQNIYVVLGDRVSQIVKQTIQNLQQKSVVLTVPKLSAQIIHQCLMQSKCNE